jgi:hypothetical protein
LLIANFEFGKFSFLLIVVETWDVTNPSPLQKISSRDLRKLGTKEIWVLSPHKVFSLPSGFFFGVVTPLDLQKLDTSGTGGSESFFQDANRYFAVCQI